MLVCVSVSAEQFSLGSINQSTQEHTLPFVHILEDRSIFNAGGCLFTFEVDFELRSRLPHQPMLQDGLCPLLI